MARAPRMTSTELLRLLQRKGLRVVRQRGSHAVLRHPSRTGRIVVPLHPARTLKPKTVAAILDAAGINVQLERGVEE